MTNQFDSRLPAMILESRKMLKEQFETLPKDHWWWRETTEGQEKLLDQLSHDVAIRTLNEMKNEDRN